MSSIGGLRRDAAIGVYNTTKAAIVHLTRILAVELAPACASTPSPRAW